MKETVVVFKLNQDEYAIPITYILSIEKADHIQMVDDLPNYCTGTLHVRDQAFPIFDFKYILYGENSNINQECRVILLETEKLAYGLLVQDVDEVLDVNQEAIKPLGIVSHLKTKYCSSIIQMEDRLLTMLDAEGILDVLDNINVVFNFIAQLHQEV